MITQKKKIHRILLLDSIGAMLTILILSCLFFFGLQKQQNIANNIYRHPFAVSNAALEFRSNVLEFRNLLLEIMITHKKIGQMELDRFRHFQDQFDSSLKIIKREFLGDRNRVDSIILEMESWKNLRETVKAEILAGEYDSALEIATHDVTPHIEQILVGIDYVISFARSRAALFMEESKIELVKSRIILAIIAVFSLFSYVLLSKKLRHTIHRIYEQAEFNATFDELTGAYNRRSFIALCETEVERAHRYHLPLSLVMMDIDHFKEVNDSLGHDSGDAILRQFCRICLQNLRETDCFGRLGGDEFAILLPHSELQSAIDVAERIRQVVAGCNFKTDKRNDLKLTTSIGVVRLNQENECISKILKRADEAMYRSKTGGRNRITEG